MIKKTREEEINNLTWLNSKGQRDAWTKPKVVQKYRWRSCWTNEAEIGREVPPNCADSAKEEVLHSQCCLQILPACGPEGPIQKRSDNPYGHTPKRKHVLYGVKNKSWGGPVFLCGIAQQRQAGWNPSPKINLLLCFSCHSSNVQPVGCKGDSLVPLVMGCRGLCDFVLICWCLLCWWGEGQQEFPIHHWGHGHVGSGATKAAGKRGQHVEGEMWL